MTDGIKAPVQPADSAVNELFKYGVAVLVEISVWPGNVKIPSVEVLDRAGVDPAAIGASKRLFDRKALKAIQGLRSEARDWLYANTVEILGRRFATLARLPAIDAKLAEFEERFGPLADAFVADLSALKAATRIALGPLYDESDYPDDPRSKFSFDYHFETFQPAGRAQLVTPELVAREEAKFRTGVESMTRDLYARLAGVVDHLVERLSTDREDGKPQVFRDTLVGNAREFFDAFRGLDGLNGEFAQLVSKAEQAIDGVPDAQALRDSAGLRAQVAERLSEVAAVLDGMTIDRPERKLRFGAAKPASAESTQVAA